MDVEFSVRELYRILDAVENPPTLTPLKAARLFEQHRRGKIFVVPEIPDDTELWFVGDVHGDLLALETALHHIGPTGRIIFLGDLFDDGIHGAEVVSRIAGLPPERFTILAGNHDEGLVAGNKFSSQVQPAEFSEWLNQHPEARQFGDSIVEFFRDAPRAIFLPDGLLVTHGGFPLRDRWAPLDFNDPRSLQDFVWTRASETARTKIPNRSTKGCQFGSEDFTGFCETATAALGQPVQRMIRGHDHVEERFLIYPRYQANPVLVVNTLSHRLQREVLGPYERTACVARWVPGQLPEVHRLVLPVEIIQRVYPEPMPV